MNQVHDNDANDPTKPVRDTTVTNVVDGVNPSPGANVRVNLGGCRYPGWREERGYHNCSK